MSRILIASLVASLGVLGASVPAVADVGARWMVTEAKAERLLVRDATIRFAPSDRAVLEEELLQEIRQFRALELAAFEAGDDVTRWVYKGVADRYETVLQTVRRGLDVQQANCSGAGRSIAGKRFERFHCLVTSETLTIPVIQLETFDGRLLPSVVENRFKSVGPLMTQYRVRMTGRSSIEYR